MTTITQEQEYFQIFKTTSKKILGDHFKSQSISHIHKVSAQAKADKFLNELVIYFAKPENGNASFHGGEKVLAFLKDFQNLGWGMKISYEQWLDVKEIIRRMNKKGPCNHHLTDVGTPNEIDFRLVDKKF